MTKPPAEPEAARRARVLKEMAAYEAARPDMIPGSASHDGRQATGGRYYFGHARMAMARELAGVPLDATDREALRRWPVPEGWVGS